MEFQRTGDKYEDLKEEKIKQALNRRKANIMRIVFAKRRLPIKPENPLEQNNAQMEIEETEAERTLGQDKITNLNKTEEQNVRDKSFDVISNKNDFLINKPMKNNGFDNRAIININNATNNTGFSNNINKQNINLRITLEKKNPSRETVNTGQTIKIHPIQIEQNIISKETEPNNNSNNIPQAQGDDVNMKSNISHNQGKSDCGENEQIANLNKPLINYENFNLKVFLTKINSLKNTDNYKLKGPYIYCAVVRKINSSNNETNRIRKKIKEKASESLYSLYLYHAGIFECTKKLIIHYGENDENENKKPLSLESKNDNEISEYQVYKYFYSKEAPEKFINLIDKNEWISKRFSILFHNCIHCVNEYLLLNNISPISFGPFKNQRNIAYPYLCDKCLNDLGRAKMYIKAEKKFNFSKAFFNLSGETFETINIEFKKEDYIEYSYRCQKCFDNPGEWKYNDSWLKKSEEENEKFLIFTNELDESAENELNKFEKVGELLDDLLIKVQIKNLPNYQYGLIRKDLIVNSEKNLGFVALASLNENKIIEYGNEKYNNGSPVLRDINLEDKILYHTVRVFKLNKNVNELFNSINLTPWTSNRYDIYHYNSYNFINIYLNKYHQKLFLIKNAKIFNSAFHHLCRDCYKKLNHLSCYVGPTLSSFHYSQGNINNNKKEDQYWWCWDCGKKNATFHFV